MRSVLASFLLAGGLCACSESTSTGRVQVFAAAEDSIPDGLQPGEGEENIKDGWTISYQKYLVSIGNFRASRSADAGDLLSEPRVYVLDLRNLPTQGFTLASFDSASALRYDKVGYDLPNASATAAKPAEVSQADYDLMVQNGWSLYIEATLTKADGTSCKPAAPADCVPRAALTVAWGLRAGTSYEDCAPSVGDAGFAVPTGGTVQVKPTIHGDHWFFTNLTQGAELTERRAQWVADSDLDRDGRTTLEELKLVKAADLFRAPTYNLTGAIIPISSAYDYLEAQARTLGDFQGDGECPTRRVL